MLTKQKCVSMICMIYSRDTIWFPGAKSCWVTHENAVSVLAEDFLAECCRLSVHSEKLGAFKGTPVQHLYQFQRFENCELCPPRTAGSPFT